MSDYEEAHDASEDDIASTPVEKLERHYLATAAELERAKSELDRAVAEQNKEKMLEEMRESTRYMIESGALDWVADALKRADAERAEG
ncbi:hypothetical protein ACRAJ3_25210 [Rhodococcus pyridinivorans]|uniref:hypothetical protein n=1 Tax=Rhodococcus pyridinivorans TaxID=103816 RepID=UPI003D7F50E5